jgi:hypothetical protein
VSLLAPETVEIAAALARHARQGRDLRLAVLGWFAESGLSEVLDTVVPEPPEPAVLDALAWMTTASPWYQLFALARAAQTEAQKDAFYTACSDRILGRWLDLGLRRRHDRHPCLSRWLTGCW